MPRGRDTFDLEVPLRGLQLNLPPQQVGLDGLLGGQNMYLDGDGLYRARHGYQPMTTGVEPGFRIMGGFWFKDTDGVEVFIAVGTQRASALLGTGWTDITGPNPLNGTEDDPVRFVEYWQNGQVSVIFVNNADSPKIWTSRQATYYDLTPVYQDTGTLNAFHIVANQQTLGPGGIVQFFMLPASSNTGAATLTWVGPLGASNTLPINYINNGLPTALAANMILAGVGCNLTYDPTLGYIRLNTNVPAPAGRDICVVNNRVVIYNVVVGATRTPMQLAWTTTFDATVWGQDNYFLLTDSNDPGVAIRQFGNQAALVYGEQSIWLMRSLGISDAQAFTFNRLGEYQPGPVSSAGVVVIETIHYFLANDQRIWKIDGGLTPTPISDQIYPLLLSDFDQFYQTRQHSVYYPQLRQIWFIYGSTGIGDPMHALCMRINDVMFEPLQTFAEGITASWSGEQALGNIWDTSLNPWNTYLPAWNQFPTRKQMHMFLGTAAGLVMRFSTDSSSDNGVPISYSMTPGLMSLGSLLNVQPDSLELFILSTGAEEYLRVMFQSLRFPLDPNPLTIFEMPLLTSDNQTFALASLLPSDKRTFRWIQMTISGQTTTRAFSFGGGTFFAYQEDRGTREGS